MTDSLHFVFVELDRFDKKWEDIDNDKERFYFCIRHMRELESLPEGLAEGLDGYFSLLFDCADRNNISSAALSVYDDMERDEQTIECEKRDIRIDAREEALEEGLAEGLAKGLAKGEAKGRAEGRAEGITAGRSEATFEMAKKMKAKGFSTEDITDCTGLSVEEVEKL